MRVRSESILFLVALFCASCQDPNPFGEFAEGNSKIEKTNIFGEDKFYPQESILTNSNLFIIGDNGFEKDETIIYSYNQSLAKIALLKHAELGITHSGDNGIYIYGRTKLADPKIKNPVSWPTDKLIFGRITDSVINYNPEFKTPCSEMIECEGVLVAKQEDNDGSWSKLVVSNDNGSNWEKINFFYHFISMELWYIHDSILFVYGSNKGFKKEDYSIFKYDLKSKMLLEEIPIKSFKGEFPELIMMGKKPTIQTRVDNKIYIYQLLNTDLKPEVVLTPKGRYVGEIFKTDELTVIVTTPEEEKHSNNRYQIYSKRKNQKDWVLDLEAPNFVAYDFSNGVLVGFDINHNMIKLTY